MRAISVAFLALAALGLASTLDAAKADSAMMEERDTQGMSNDWNHWKYPSQSWNLGTRYYCNALNCLYKLDRETVTRAGPR